MDNEVTFSLSYEALFSEAERLIRDREHEKVWGNYQIASGRSKITGIKPQLSVANRYSSWRNQSRLPQSFSCSPFNGHQCPLIDFSDDLSRLA